jgi:sugar phosphate isomerase/epimerase
MPSAPSRALPRFRLGVQLWTVREDWQKDPIATLGRLSDLGFEGIELYGELPLPAIDLHAALKRFHLHVAAAHVGDHVSIDLNERMREARILGHDHFVFSFAEAAFVDPSETLALAQAANRRCAALTQNGFRMSLHHHDWEFASPERGRDFLQACDQPGLEFDLYWLAAAGLDPVSWVQRYAPRLRLIHAKDGTTRKGDPMTALGAGLVPVAQAIEAALLAQAPLEWVLVELDDCAGDVWQALRESRAYLNRYVDAELVKA